jgi:hypothetical protein
MPAAPDPAKSRDIVVVTAAQFSLAFALNFMFVFLPFYVHAISPLDEAATLRWTGLIMGAASAMATFGSAFWGNLTDRFSPKTLFERGILSHVILVALMGFVTDLRLLLGIRILHRFDHRLERLHRGAVGPPDGHVPIRPHDGTDLQPASWGHGRRHPRLSGRVPGIQPDAAHDLRVLPVGPEPLAAPATPGRQ